MKSKTKIKNQLVKKTNPELVETIILANKNSKWQEIAGILSGPKRKRKDINLNELEKTKGDVLVCGKILSDGEVETKRKIIALGFSEKAEEKLKKAGCEIVLIKNEILKNKEMKGINVIK